MLRSSIPLTEEALGALITSVEVLDKIRPLLESVVILTLVSPRLDAVSLVLTVTSFSLASSCVN